LPDNLRKQAQLCRSPSALAFDAPGGKRSFANGGLDQFVANGDDLVGDFLKEGGAPLQPRLAVCIECIFRGRAKPCHIARRPSRKPRFDAAPRCGINAMDQDGPTGLCRIIRHVFACS
jgi:hypothetical protein